VRQALIILGVFLACVAAHAEEPPIILSPADLKAARNKIINNWNVAPALASECSLAMVVRIHVGADGTVETVTLLDPQPLAPSCEQAADSAKRAIWKSSPLPVSQGPADFDVNFDHTKIE
jgi:hypothetical protein